jgi:lipid-A-disaccharide synthase
LTKTIFIIAGEASGDVIGAKFIKAVSKIDSSAEFVGVGGDMMIEAGLKPVFPLKDISVIGIAEILSNLFRILTRLRTVIKTIENIKPKALVVIDFPGFNDRVAIQSKKLGIPVIRYVAPQVWAWRPWRAGGMTKFADCLFTLFEFEPPLFEKHGLKSFFVGHPVVEDSDLVHPSAQGVDEFFNRYELIKSDPLVCLFPGSRSSEIRRHVPIFLNAVKMLKQDIPNLQVFIPTFNDYFESLKKSVNDKWIVISTNRRDKGIAMRSAVCALAASGTVTLELAYTATPTIVAYKVSQTTAFILKRLINIGNVSLVNILLKETAIPELLQKDCTAAALYKHMLSLVTNSELRDLQTRAFKKIKAMIAPSNKVMPSEKAAKLFVDRLGL